MHLPVKSKLNTFLKNMEAGALYFEFSDGYRFAIDKGVYENGVGSQEFESLTNIINVSGSYKEIINTIISDKSFRFLSNIYYKAYNLDNGDIDKSSSVWVDFKSLIHNAFEDVYKTSWENRGIANIDTSLLKSVMYIDSKKMSHYIGDRDGDAVIGKIANNIIFPMKERGIVTIEQFDIDNNNNIDPLKLHLKQDIKINVNPNWKSNVNGVHYNLNNSLIWAGGVFTVNNSLDTDTKVIPKGKMFLSTKTVAYKGDAPLVKFSDPEKHATFDPDPLREDKRWDFDIKIFKWDKINISEFKYSILNEYKQYIHVDNDPLHKLTINIDYLNSIYFNSPVSENHLLFHNGVIVGRDKYTVVGEKITFIYNKFEPALFIPNLYKEFINVPNPLYNTDSLANIVEELLPKGGEYSLVEFTNAIPGDVIKLNRSTLCYKNHPYPFNVTFPELSIGDLVTIDGAFERYMHPEKYVVKYPYTTYMSRYTDHNLLNDSVVERIWFTII